MKYSVPVLDEPFDFDFTYIVYQEDEQDYGCENGGKPFHSFIVRDLESYSSGYIRKLSDAKSLIASKIESDLKKVIEDSRRRMNAAGEALRVLEAQGVDGFEVQ